MSYSARTLVLIGLGVTLVAGLSYVSFREDPVPVDLATVTRGRLEVTINADGQSQAPLCVRLYLKAMWCARAKQLLPSCNRLHLACWTHGRSFRPKLPYRRQWPLNTWPKPI
jgi:hypothetical protein